MTDSFKVQGWCPTAWQPMRSQDGWIVRVRPRCASIRVAQWRVLAELALSRAQPLIELTRLGNVQLRGVDESQLDQVRARLIEAQLVPPDADVDLAPPVHCTPLYQRGDATHALAECLSTAVVEHLSPSALHGRGLNALPSKFGFAVDDAQRRLQCMNADIDLWVTEQGQYALRAADSAKQMLFATAEQAVAAAIDKAQWFAGDRVLRKPVAVRLRSLAGATLPEVADIGEPIQPGLYQERAWIVGVPLGRIDAKAMLAATNALPEDAEIRVTPWRSLLVGEELLASGNPFADTTHWITHPDDARLRASSCVGLPRCEQGRFGSQELSVQIAPHVPVGVHVHVSGCAKFCALSADATVVISPHGVDDDDRVLLSVEKNEKRMLERTHAAMPVSLEALRAEPQTIQKLIHDLHL